MCILLRYFSPCQRFICREHQTQEEFSENPIMSKHAINSVDSKGTVEATGSILRNRSSKPEASSTQISSSRNSNVNTRNVRRVTFQETVVIRTYPINDSVEATTNDTIRVSIDDIDSLTEEVASRLSIRAKDASTPSLDDLCHSITSDVDGNTSHGIRVLPSTSGSDRPSDQAPTTSSPPNVLTKPSQFDEEYAQMDLLIRNNYPNYYHFLKSHIIRGAVGSQDYRCQELEFQEAIVGCSQYPEEYFLDLERSLNYYEKLSRETETRR